MAYSLNPFTSSRHVASTRVMLDRPDDESLDDDVAGCGWYDSSFELSQGLEVCEIAWTDANPVAFMAG